MEIFQNNCKDKKILDLEVVDKSGTMKAFEFWIQDNFRTNY